MKGGEKGTAINTKQVGFRQPMANTIENKEPTNMAPSAMMMMGNINFKVAALFLRIPYSLMANPPTVLVIIQLSNKLKGGYE